MKNRVVHIVGTVLVSLCLVTAYSFAASSQATKQPKGSAHGAAGPKMEVGTTPAPDPGAVRGGVLRAIRSTFPKVLGYQPEQTPTDTIFALLYGERLVRVGCEGEPHPGACRIVGGRSRKQDHYLSPPQRGQVP